MASPSRTRPPVALAGLRIVLSGLIAAHGWGRLVSNAVAPFGIFLEGQGFPFGFALAIAVTAMEILGTPLLAWGRWVLPLCLVYSGIFAAGIVTVHASEGWFVVGLGRNGMEYSVLLIACLLYIASQHFPRNSPPEVLGNPS